VCELIGHRFLQEQAPATRCNDVAPIGQFRHFARFGNFGCTLGGSMGKGREPEVILKTDERRIILDLRLERKFTAR
jgi:hypothetical protein